MKAIEKLRKKNNEGKFVCVGLDTDIEKIPQHLRKSKNPILEFNKRIIESCSKDAAAFKINFAFYEKDGSKGFQTILETLSAIPDDDLTIADAKRGDIGNSSQMYSKAILNEMNFDSVTVNPYLGKDSVWPFLENPDKLIFILALTSNPGAEDFEKVMCANGKFLFQNVIEKVNEWNIQQNCGIVFGATKSEELGQNINLFGGLPVLLPGIGAQGGNLPEVIKVFKRFNRKDFLINVSRGIIYKSNNTGYAEAAQKELKSLNAQIDQLFND